MAAEYYFMKKYFLFLFFISLIAKFFFLSSCANIIPPGGGPKDSLPPVLINALPKDSTLHFNANKITLEFDEYVQLDNALQNELVVSPNPVTLPVIDSKLRTVTIRIKDSLKPNTTYSIDFGKALKDVNEGNILRNFIYVFSTGNKLDDGKLSGTVTLAETGGADSTLIVVLHKNLNDSAVKKERPEYFAKLDGKGNFRFHNLPTGKFAVYVLPNDYTKKYDDSTKMFAFLNAPVDIDSNKQLITMHAYEEEKRKEKGAATAAASGAKKPGAEPKKLIYNINLNDRKQDLLENLEFSFTTKLAKFDSSKIILTDTNYKPVSGYNILADTSLKIFSLKYNWTEDQYFRLIIDSTAFEDSSGNRLAKIDTISFKTKKESEYGSMRLRFNNIDLSKNPVLEFVKDNKIIDAYSLTQKELFRKLYRPGDYELRILYDDNKNGVWDPGNFDLKRQPEIVQKIPKKLTIKGNWDNEVDIIL